MNLSLSFSFTSNRFYFYDDRKNLTWAKLLFAVSKDNGEERERERERERELNLNSFLYLTLSPVTYLNFFVIGSNSYIF